MDAYVSVVMADNIRKSETCQYYHCSERGETLMLNRPAFKQDGPRRNIAAEHPLWNGQEALLCLSGASVPCETKRGVICFRRWIVDWRL